MSKGVLYKIRRKGQRLVARLFSKEMVSKLYYRIRLKQKLNLADPKSFTEKLQWLKLYYCPNESKVVQCADKYSVREYVSNIGEAALLNDLIGVWNSTEDIEWCMLPDQFVLKCTHGCGYNIICADKQHFDIATAKKKLDKWMQEDYSLFDIEPHYGKIKPRIICEKYLGAKIVNYNIYCFRGEPVFFSLVSGLGDGMDERLTYYYANGQKTHFRNRAFETDDAQLSVILPQLMECAKRLAKGFPMVRVDLFEIEGRIILSELTFTPGGALIPFEPYAADQELGQLLDISNEIEQWKKSQA